MSIWFEIKILIWIGLSVLLFFDSFSNLSTNFYNLSLLVVSPKFCKKKGFFFTFTTCTRILAYIYIAFYPICLFAYFPTGTEFSIEINNKFICYGLALQKLFTKSASRKSSEKIPKAIYDCQKIVKIYL